MKKTIIAYSPVLYSIICFITNLILWVALILTFTLPFGLSRGQLFFWISLLLSFFFIFAFWFCFWLTKKHGLNSLYRFPFINSGTATSQLFIFFHQNQKTKLLEKGFKLIKILGTFTSWFWLFYLIHRKDQSVRKVIYAFKQFVNLNEKIYRLVDLQYGSLFLGPFETDYILVEI